MVFIAIVSAVFNVPVLISLLLIVFFASIGISLGVRRAYIKVLLKIFEVRIPKQQTAAKSQLIAFFLTFNHDLRILMKRIGVYVCFVMPYACIFTYHVKVWALESE